MTAKAADEGTRETSTGRPTSTPANEDAAIASSSEHVTGREGCAPFIRPRDASNARVEAHKPRHQGDLLTLMPTYRGVAADRVHIAAEHRRGGDILEDEQ